MNPRNLDRDEILAMVAKMNLRNGVREMNPSNGGRDFDIPDTKNVTTTTVKDFDILSTKKVTKKCSKCGVTI